MQKELAEIIKECKNDIIEGNYEIVVHTCIREKVDPYDFISLLFRQHHIYVEPCKYFNTILLENILTDFTYMLLSEVTHANQDFELYDELTFINVALDRFNIEVYKTPYDDYIVMDKSREDLEDVVYPESPTVYERITKELTNI